MDSETLFAEFDYVSANGTTITSEERALLYNTLSILKYEGKFKTVLLCAKILGLSNSYYIAQGIGRDILRQRQTFYSTNGKKWVLLTPPETFHVQLCRYIPKQFSGDPAFEVKIKIPTFKEVEELTADVAEGGGGIGGAGEEAMLEEEEGHAEEDLPPLRIKSSTADPQEKNEEFGEEEEQEIPVLTEEERLAGVYQQIDHDTAIAPRGAFLRTPTGDVLVNQFFRGLDETQARRLDSYIHVRFPDRAISEIRRRRSEMEKSLDFLDVVEEDIPNGCWSIQVDEIQGVVVVRNLWWPGMVFYHRIKSANFGYFYCGNGLKNNDLPFML